MPKPCRSGCHARPASHSPTARSSAHTGGTDRSAHSAIPEPNPEHADLAPSFQHISTRAVPADSRLEYWRKQFPTSRIEPPGSANHPDFRGKLVSTTPWRDTMFADLDSDPVISHFGVSDNSVVLLGCIRTGVVNIHHGHHATLAVDRNSGLLLFDCDRPFVTTSGRCAMTYLALPRQLVIQALGCEPVGQGKAARLVQPGALTSGYLRHLHALAASADKLAGASATHALRTARSLALTLLASREPRWRSLPYDFDDALLASARHLLALHAGDPQLTADHLARMLGCSRAHLYRLYARAKTTIAGELRDVRMRQAHALIQSSPREPIGAIAWRCGYTDFSAFGKAFRRHFDMTPTDCRHLATDSA